MNKEIKSRKVLREKTKGIEIETEEGEKFLKQKYEGRSRDVRKSQLKHYLVYREKSCKDLIDEAADDWDKDRRERDFVAEHYLTKFERWMREEMGYSSHTVNNHVTCIRSFYKFNNYPLNSDRLNLKSDNPTPKPKNQARRIDKKTIKKLYNSTTSKRNRALLLFLYQTGQGANEISILDYGDVKYELEKERYPLKISYSQRKNSGLSYCTFLGADGIQALKDYLGEREEKLGRELRDDDPLFAKRNGKDRLSSNAIAETLKYITKKAPDDLISDEEMEKADINPFRPHAFRKNFKTQLVKGAINNLVIEYLMGHKLEKVQRSYWIGEKMGGEENLRKIYAEKIEPELSIDVESTIAEVSTSSGLKDNWKELFREKLGEDVVFKEKHEEDMEKLRSKWLDRWLDSREEIDKLREDLKEQSEMIREELKEEISRIISDLRDSGVSFSDLKKAVGTKKERETIGIYEKQHQKSLKDLGGVILKEGGVSEASITEAIEEGKIRKGWPDSTPLSLTELRNLKNKLRKWVGDWKAFAHLRESLRNVVSDPQTETGEEESRKLEKLEEYSFSDVVE